MSSTEGIPEGWELVRVGKPLAGEFFIDGLSYPHQAMDDQHFHGCAIIRKIPKPKTYRPFANAAEYMPHWGKPVKYQGSVGFDSVVSTSELGVYTAQGRMVQFLTMEQAFGFLKFADGSPFGAEVTS